MEVDLVADMTVINPFDFFLEKYAEEFPFQYDPVLTRELTPTLKARRAGKKLPVLAEVSCEGEKLRTIDFLRWDQPAHSRHDQIF